MNKTETFLSDLLRVMEIHTPRANDDGWIAFNVADTHRAFLKAVNDGAFELCAPLNADINCTDAVANAALVWNHVNAPWRIVVDGTGALMTGRYIDVRTVDPDAFLAILETLPEVSNKALIALSSVKPSNDNSGLPAENFIRV